MFSARNYLIKLLYHFTVAAGLDASRFTLRWAILHMAAYPEIQNKVQEEIDRVVGMYHYVPMQQTELFLFFFNIKISLKKK